MQVLDCSVIVDDMFGLVLLVLRGMSDHPDVSITTLSVQPDLDDLVEEHLVVEISGFIGVSHVGDDYPGDIQVGIDDPSFHIFTPYLQMGRVANAVTHHLSHLPG